MIQNPRDQAALNLAEFLHDTTGYRRIEWVAEPGTTQRFTAVWNGYVFSIWKVGVGPADPTYAVGFSVTSVWRTPHLYRAQIPVMQTEMKHVYSKFLMLYDVAQEYARYGEAKLMELLGSLQAVSATASAG